MKNLLDKINGIWINLPGNIKGLIILISLLVLGIILRWKYIINSISDGFNFYSK